MLLSVIIPVYNSELFLERCIKSIIAQRISDAEFIFINDGSTDSSHEILEFYKEKDNRIIVINQENLGVSKARNKALSICKGKYVGFVDADDYIDRRMFELLLMKILNDKSDLVICNYTKIYYENELQIKKDIIFKENNYENDITNYYIEYFCKNHDNGYLWNKLYRSEVIKNNNLKFKENLSMCEDLLFNIEYLMNIKRISYINENLYNYILTNKSSTYKFHKNAFEARKLIYEKTLKICKMYGIDSNEINRKYAKYANIYMKENYKRKDIKLNEKYEIGTRIINNNYTKSIQKWVKNNKKECNLKTRIFYFLTSRTKILIHIYIYILAKLSK